MRVILRSDKNWIKIFETYPIGALTDSPSSPPIRKEDAL